MAEIDDDGEIATGAAGPQPAESSASPLAPEMEDALREHYTWILRWCLFELRDRSQAFDCAQDVMIQVAQSLSGFERRSQFRTWLYVIVRRTIGRFRRQLQRRESFFAREVDAAAGDAQHEGGSAPPDAELLMQRKETLSRVVAAMDELPTMQRSVLYLHYFEDCGVERCAERLGVTPGTIKTHLHRGRERLRKLLGEEHDETGDKGGRRD